MDYHNPADAHAKSLKPYRKFDNQSHQVTCKLSLRCNRYGFIMKQNISFKI